MPTAFDNRNLIDGVAEVIVKDETGSPLTLATHATTASSTTVLEMASSPIAAGFRAGDVVQVTLTGTEARKIASLTATQIVLEEALAAAPGTGVNIVRCGINLGYTDNGVQVATKTDFQERYADQSLDPISVKPDKRTSSIKTTLLEIFGTSALVALNLDSSAVAVSAGNTTIKVGNASLILRTFGCLIIGAREGGDKVTVFASKCVNQGEAGFEFSKSKASGFALDLKLINDSGRPAGEELYVVKIGANHDFSYLLLA